MSDPKASTLNLIADEMAPPLTLEQWEMLKQGIEQRVDDAVAQVLVELAFLVPSGTDISKHPIAGKLKELLTAVRKSERLRASMHTAPDPAKETPHD